MGELTTELNRLAGTTGLTDVAAANVWAGTTGRELVAALNVKAGTTGRGLEGALNAIAGTTGRGVNGALTGYTAGTPVTYTINADLTDGYLLSASPTMSSATVDTVAATAYVGTNTNQYIEAFFSFDTSAAAGTITSATLSFYVGSNSANDTFTVEVRAYDWGATLDAADGVPAASLGALPLVATMPAAGGTHPFPNNRYNLTSTAAMLTAINQSGATRFVVSSSRHRLGTAPTQLGYIGLNTRDTGTVQCAKLVIQALA